MLGKKIERVKSFIEFPNGIVNEVEIFFSIESLETDGESLIYPGGYVLEEYFFEGNSFSNEEILTIEMFFSNEKFQTHLKENFPIPEKKHSLIY